MCVEEGTLASFSLLNRNSETFFAVENHVYMMCVISTVMTFLTAFADIQVSIGICIRSIN